MNKINSLMRNRRKELGLTMKDVAKAVGVSEATVSRWESGNIANMGRDKINALSKVLNLSPISIMGISDNIDDFLELPSNIIPITKVRRIPVIGKIACGTPILAVENVTDNILLPDYIQADFALICQGDSMINAKIDNGDTVYIRKQDVVENGEIAAVLIGNEATLKKVYKYPEKNMLVLKPANPEYEDFIFTGEELEEIRILGKAVAFLSSI